MQNFQTQINDLISGSTALTTAQLDDFLTASAKAVMDILPNELLMQYATVSSTSSSVLAVQDKRVIRVMLDIDKNFIAVYKDAGLEAHFTDADSIHYADSTSPIYTALPNGTLKCYPTGTEAAVTFTTYPTVTYNLTTISSFPTTAEYAVVLASAIKAAQSILNDIIHTDEDVELASTMQLELANLQALYTAEIQRLIS